MLTVAPLQGFFGRLDHRRVSEQGDALPLRITKNSVSWALFETIKAMSGHRRASAKLFE